MSQTNNEYSFCESSVATGMWRWHIRKIGTDGRKPGGGASSPLCFIHEGRTWTNGWDIEVPMTEHHMRENACRKCLALFDEKALEEVP